MAEISNENYEFGRENTKQQFHGGTADKAMNETSHKQKFQRTDSYIKANSDPAFRDAGGGRYDYEASAAADLPPPDQNENQWQRYTNTVEVDPVNPDIHTPAMPAFGQAEAPSPYFKSTDEKIRDLDARSAKMQEKIDKYDDARGSADARKKVKEYGGKDGGDEGGVRV
ncbi:MAG: hypothetical protein K2N41_04775, partial [Lachnospiraceae bacterium]|nr:hypothetical protein [Lachnospiraceae bacterium]